MMRPSGEKASADTVSRCPRYVLSASPELESQRFTRRLSPAETRSEDLAEYATKCTGLSCSRIWTGDEPMRASHNATIASRPAEMKRDESPAKATASIAP